MSEVDGHNHQEIFDGCNKKPFDQPLCIVANTIKGKGVSFMENNILWHYRSPQEEEYRLAMKELEKKDA